MTAAAVLIRNSSFWITDDIGDYVEIDGVRAVTGIQSGSPQTSDDTRLNSTVIVTLYGLRNEGQFNLALSANPDDEGQAILDEIAYSGDTRHFVIVFPSGILTKRYWHFDVKSAGVASDMQQNDIALTGQCQISIISQVLKVSVDPR